MKKLIVSLFLVSLGIILVNKDEKIIIHNEAIRFRVIANSNSVSDQALKMNIKEEVEKEVYELINGANNVENVRSILKDNLDVIEDIVDDYNVPYNINYGNNYFPLKSYKGVMYPAGNYESLVITLGEGVGNNFWCVLFPPLCLLENSSEDISDIEYQSYIKKLIGEF